MAIFSCDGRLPPGTAPAGFSKTVEPISPSEGIRFTRTVKRVPRTLTAPPPPGCADTSRLMPARWLQAASGHLAEGLELLGPTHDQQHLILEQLPAAIGKHVEFSRKDILDPHHLHADLIAKIGLGERPA